MADKSVKGAFDTFQGVGEAPPKEKPKKVNFTISHDAGTKELLDDLQWLKQYVVDRQPVSQGDIVREALEELAKKWNYAKLKKEYAEDLANATIKIGRKTGR
ncbi:MAG: hypothetical protein AAF363_21675 [Bacteroidota bacterium]